MNPIAIIINNTQIHWDAIIIIMAIPAWFFSFHSLYCTRKGRIIGSWVFLPFALLLGALFSRLLYWYSHVEQYKSFGQALDDHSIGCFSMLGLLPGLFLAAVLIRCLRLSKNLPAFLDALAPATAMGMGLMYLSCLFNYNCRGKFTVDIISMQHLPFASAVPEAGENVFRFATFFWSAAFMFILSYICTEFYYIKKKEYGSTACLFLLIFSAGQFILDSTRYDAEYFPFNGFVSILQIFDGVAILALTIAFSVRLIKRRGFKWYYILLWLGQAGSMTATGLLEYMVQRYSDRHLKYYGFMFLSCVCMFLFAFVLYLMGCTAKKARKAAVTENTDEVETRAAAVPAEQKTKENLKPSVEMAASKKTDTKDHTKKDLPAENKAAVRKSTAPSSGRRRRRRRTGTVSQDTINFLSAEDLDAELAGDEITPADSSSAGVKNGDTLTYINIDEDEDEYKYYDEEDEIKDERPAIIAFICAALAAVGLSALFASRNKD